MSSYYNNIPIEEYINVEYANVDTINASTVKTQNLYIDNVKSTNNITTQKITLDTKEIDEIITSSNSPYTNDNKKICSKGYIDEKIDNATPDLSTCVKNNSAQTLTNKFIMTNTNNELTASKIIINSNEINNINKVSDDTSADNKTLYTKKKIDNLLSNCVKNNENQTLTNKFIMSNTSNEININKLKIKDYDNNNNTDTIEKIKTGGNSDNDTLTTKGYVDNSISSIPAPDLSSCVKNTGDQTLTNKFIMSNTSNEININKLKIKDYDDNNTIDTIDKIKTGGNSDNDTLTTKGYIDNNYVNKNDGVGKNYYVSDTLKGEIFNDYSNNQASGSKSHCEGAYNTASGVYAHAEGLSTKALGNYSHTSGYYTQADQDFQTAIGEYNTTSNTNALLSIGNGTNTNARSDALNVYRDGEVKINSTATGTTPKLTIGNSKSITATTALNTSTQADDAILSTKKYVDDLINIIYPIGSIYISKNSTNPATLFGIGTWSLIKGKFIYGADPDNLTNYPINDTGGGSKQISTSNIPLLTTSSNGSGTASWSSRDTQGIDNDVYSSSGKLSLTMTKGVSYSSGSGSIQGGQSFKLTVNSHSHTVGNTSPTDYMPPYIVRYIWERTA